MATNVNLLWRSFLDYIRVKRLPPAGGTGADWSVRAWFLAGMDVSAYGSHGLFLIVDDNDDCYVVERLDDPYGDTYIEVVSPVFQDVAQLHRWLRKNLPVFLKRLKKLRSHRPVMRVVTQ